MAQQNESQNAKEENFCDRSINEEQQPELSSENIEKRPKKQSAKKRSFWSRFRKKEQQPELTSENIGEEFEKHVFKLMTEYNDKADKEKKRYYWMRGITIVLSALIPFIAGFEVIGFDVSFVAENKNQILGFLGVIITILSAFVDFFNFKENRKRYRVTAGKLKRERYLFLARTDEYSCGEESLKKFVSKVEDIIRKEHESWEEYVGGDKDKVKANVNVKAEVKGNP